jgi:hypothetical protein
MDSLELNKDTETGNEIPKKTARQPQSKKAKDTATPIATSEVVDSEQITASTLKNELDMQQQTKDSEGIEIPSNSSTTTNTPNLNNLSKEELVNALRESVNKDIADSKEEVESIKQLFYKKNKIEIDELKKQWVIENGEEIPFVAPHDTLEDELKKLLLEFKSKKAAVIAKIEKEREDNLLQKRHILEQMKNFSETNDDVSIHINDFRTLQQKWKLIGQVPQSAINELWKQYNTYQEKFWDLVKINNEFREYDFRKNLEIKNLICESAEKIALETDIISAFQQLQKLHEDWHNTGPVAREFRESLWARFKEASTTINKKHQSHFESIRKLEEVNYTSKITLCEKIENIDASQISTYKEWDEATKLVLTCQEE